MQINSVVNSRIIQHQKNFKGNPTENVTVLDNFNNDMSTKTTKKQSPNFFTKLITHPTLIVIPLLPVAGYNIYRTIKENSLKNSLRPETKIKEFNKISSRIVLALFLTSVPLYFTTDYINKKYKDKNFAKSKKQLDDFNKKNNVDIKLACSPIDQKNINIIGGFSPLTAQMLLPEKIFGDVLNSSFRRKSIINHELIHAKQYIFMASSEMGIKKINYICAKKASERLNEKQKINIKNIYEEIKNNENNKYKNRTKEINGYEINYVNYVTALYKVIYDKDANPNNIPIIINKEFYEKAKCAKGKLTKDEEHKAQLYIEAYEKYPAKVGFAKTINPFSDYRQNLLEREAYGFNNK